MFLFPGGRSDTATVTSHGAEADIDVNCFFLPRATGLHPLDREARTNIQCIPDRNARLAFLDDHSRHCCRRSLRSRLNATPLLWCLLSVWAHGTEACIQPLKRPKTATS